MKNKKLNIDNLKKIELSNKVDVRGGRTSRLKDINPEPGITAYKYDSTVRQYDTATACRKV